MGSARLEMTLEPLLRKSSHCSHYPHTQVSVQEDVDSFAARDSYEKDATVVKVARSRTAVLRVVLTSSWFWYDLIPARVHEEHDFGVS